MRCTSPRSEKRGYAVTARQAVTRIAYLSQERGEEIHAKNARLGRRGAKRQRGAERRRDRKNGLRNTRNQTLIRWLHSVSFRVFRRHHRLGFNVPISLPHCSSASLRQIRTGGEPSHSSPSQGQRASGTNALTRRTRC